MEANEAGSNVDIERIIMFDQGRLVCTPNFAAIAKILSK